MPLSATICFAWSMMLDMSICCQPRSILWSTPTPIAIFAPAFTANMDKIPVPQPTSRTTLSLNRARFWNMALRYDSVRTSSLSISSCIPSMSAVAHCELCKRTKMRIRVEIIVFRRHTIFCGIHLFGHGVETMELVVVV